MLRASAPALLAELSLDSLQVLPPPPPFLPFRGLVSAAHIHFIHRLSVPDMLSDFTGDALVSCVITSALYRVTVRDAMSCDALTLDGLQVEWWPPAPDFVALHPLAGKLPTPTPGHPVCFFFP